jgi:hypothetical protein
VIRAGTVSNMPPTSLKIRAKQWLLVGGPGNGLTPWHDASVFTASFPDPSDPTKVHYYTGRQIELDGQTYQVGIHENVFDDVEVVSLIRSSGVHPYST